MTAALSTFKQKQFHHVFPKTYLRRTATPLEHNAVANICMLAASENRQIADKDHTVYLPSCAARLEADADAVFASNLLPIPSAFDYAKGNYDRFLKARSKLVADLVADLCGGKVPG